MGPHIPLEEDDVLSRVHSGFAGAIGVVMQLTLKAEPPRILQIHREPLRPGAEAAYGRVEAETARLCAELGGPHPYLGVESLTGPKEVWFFNGYDSTAEQKQVVEDYAKNRPLLAALEKSGKRKVPLTGEPVEVIVRHRADLSRGTPWVLGQGRFLVITMTRDEPHGEGTVFEAPDGTRFIVLAERTRSRADRAAAAAGREARVFAVRPAWSFPARDWITADPGFWRP